MPSAFLFILATPLIVSWIAFVALFVLFKKKGLRLNKKQSGHFKALLISVVAAFGFFAAFADRDFVFYCQSETQKCEYYRSTLVNKELRLAETYDLSGVASVEIRERFRRRKSGYKDPYYKIAFVSPAGGFEMPREFSFRDDARDEAAEIGAFLAKEKKSYRYERLSSKNGNLFLYIMIGTLAEIVAGAGAVLFGVILYGARRNNG